MVVEGEAHVGVAAGEGGTGRGSAGHGVQQKLQVWVQRLALQGAVTQQQRDDQQDEVKGREGHLPVRHL